MINQYFSLLLIALATALVLLPLLNRLAQGCGWVDAPDERKAHHGVIPLTGGLTIALAVIIALVATALVWPGLTWPTFSFTGWPHLPWSTEAVGLLAGLVICFGIGFWDDRFPLRARYRLVAQLAAASAAVLAGNVLTSMGTTFSPVPVGLALLSVPVIMVAMTGMVNALNMSDGLDGLCGGYAAIALAAFALCAGLIASDNNSPRAMVELGPVILPFLGAVAGFLFYNLRHPWRASAASFLGDAGSMSLGFLIGWIALRLANGYGAASMPPVTAVWIVALPLIDMFACMIRRPLEGRTPMSADRRHIHHLLMARGMTVSQAVGSLQLLAIAFALVGIVGWQAHVPDYLMFWALMAIFAGYTVYSVGFWRRGLSAQPGAAAVKPATTAAATAMAESRAVPESHAVAESRGYST